MLEDLIRSLQRAGANIDAVALADALWLCGLMTTGDSNDPVSPAVEQSASPAPATDNEVIPAERVQQDIDSGFPVGGRDVFDSPGGSGSRPAVVGSAGRGSALPDDLALARALRPLKRKFPHGRDVVLDEEATVRSYVETQTLTPVFSPRPERWFHLDLVVDQSASMQVWEDVADELLTLLQQLGAFRTLHRWSLDPRGESLILRDPSGTLVRPDRLRDPHGRRLVAVFSDCVADGWHAPHIWQTLRSWARSTPTVLLNPLPPRLWPHTGLDAAVVPLAPADPGARNTDLNFTVPAALRMLAGSAADEAGDWLPCPVSGFSAVSLGAWARTLMATGTDGCQGVLIPPGGRLTEADDDTYDAFDEADVFGGPDTPAPSASPTAQQLVRSFRHLASPPASRLAVLCSPYTDLSLPLLRAVQEVMEPDSGVAELAELVVSRLFEHAPGSETGDFRLRFRPGVREELHKSLAAEDAWQVSLALNRFKERDTARRPHPVTVAADHGDTRVPDGLAAFTTAGEAAPRPRKTAVPSAILRLTVAILTNQPPEYEAVRDCLTDIEELVHQPTGTRVERGRLPGTLWHVALAEIGAGTHAATNIERVNSWLSPEAAFFVGVAGALSDNIKIGDVVVATKIYGIHLGKDNAQNFTVRPEVSHTSHRLEQAARQALHDPAVHTHFKPIAAGDTVLAAAPAIAGHLGRLYPDAVAIAMDVASVAEVSNLTGTLDTLTICGISDTADAGKQQLDTQGGRQTAARNAATAVVAILRELRPQGVPHHQDQAPTLPDTLFPDEDDIPISAPESLEVQPRWPGAPSMARIVMIAGGRTPMRAGSKFRQLGTGFLLGPRLILTTAHVVQRRGRNETVMVHNRRGRVTTEGWYNCRVLWQNDTYGAALLLTDEDIADLTTDNHFSTPRWAQLTGNEPVSPCHITGVNLADDASPEASGHLTGTLHPASQHPHGAYEFESTNPLPLPHRTKAFERGMSGAPVFFGDFFLGFTVAIRNDRAAHPRLAVACISALVNDRGFIDACSRYMRPIPRLYSLPITPSEPAGDDHAMGQLTGRRPLRVFISYAREDDNGAHAQQVRSLWELLRAAGIDALLDQDVDAEVSRDWTAWMRQEMETADYILVIASPAYKRRARTADTSRGVAFEIQLLRNELAHIPAGESQRVLPVLLPGSTIKDLPAFLRLFTPVTINAITPVGVNQFVQHLAQHPPADRTDPAEPANRYIDLAEHQWQTGLHVEALGSADLAIEIYRRLAADNPVAYHPHLVRALTIQSDFLAASGRSREALRAADEAVASTDDEIWFGPDDLRATALSTLGNRLAEVGERDHALATAEQAMVIRRQLADADPSGHSYDLARSLSNLSNRLADLERHQEALEAIDEAVTLCRHLAETNPDAFLSDLATMLNNQGAALRETGRPTEAINAAGEAVLICRRLAQTDPDAALPGLASALLNLGAVLSEVGRHGEALATAEESVTLYRQLTETRRDTYASRLAAALHNLSLRLAEAERSAEALTTIGEAIALRRSLAATDPDAFLPDLAQSLSVAAWLRTREHQDLDTALDEAEEAVVILHRFEAQLPEVFAPDLHRALTVQAATLDGLGRSDEADRIRRSLTPSPPREVTEVQIRTSPANPEEMQSLLRWLQSQPDFHGQARLVEQPSPTGLMGAAGLVALNVASPVTAFLGTALATWLMRRRPAHIALDVTMPDGRRATVSAERPDEARAALESLLGQEH
ncbi:effector-associated constant component EACC1 [Streptomyces galilaeus]|uniref:effector-associated constant component EACC1 n=1 Tax=Streptomyces galilaeus TaxID=33899 RepID=UPI0038F605CE